jgi:hypothetical protein
MIEVVVEIMVTEGDGDDAGVAGDAEVVDGVERRCAVGDGAGESADGSIELEAGGGIVFADPEGEVRGGEGRDGSGRGESAGGGERMAVEIFFFFMGGEEGDIEAVIVSVAEFFEGGVMTEGGFDTGEGAGEAAGEEEIAGCHVVFFFFMGAGGGGPGEAADFIGFFGVGVEGVGLKGAEGDLGVTFELADFSHEALGDIGIVGDAGGDADGEGERTGGVLGGNLRRDGDDVDPAVVGFGAIDDLLELFRGASGGLRAPEEGGGEEAGGDGGRDREAEEDAFAG